ncbi:MAG: hypothetical protein ACKVOK_05125 [Flavobacteriales bacterium]
MRNWIRLTITLYPFVCLATFNVNLPKHSPMNKKQVTQLAYEITGKAIKPGLCSEFRK